MKKNSIEDCLGLAIIKSVGPVLRALPLGFGLFLGRRLGDLFYYLDPKHRCQAYVNIKKALGNELSALQIKTATRKFFRSFGQNIVEVFFIPLLNRSYINKYITLEGRDNVDKAFAKGKGVILLGMHAGSWELSNVIWADMGFAFNLLVTDQKHPRMDALLNSLRISKGCKLVQRRNQLRDIVRALKNNEAVGMTVDQGGRAGELVKFFGKNASMATGAIKLALKYGSVIVPGYYARINGAHIKVIIEPPFEVSNTSDLQKDIHDNLQELVRIYEKNIRKYPYEYMWNYRVWKYTDEKEILIVNDSKAGHLRQSQAAAALLVRVLGQRGIKAKVSTVEIRLKNRLSGPILAIAALFSGKYSCQGCMDCLRKSLGRDSYEGLHRASPDFIISCGSLSSMINRMVSRENLSKSITILKPFFAGLNKFDLVIMPAHDNYAPGPNVAVITGALNLIDKDYLAQQADVLKKNNRLEGRGNKLTIGLLVGGDAKNFTLDKDGVLQMVSEVKKAAQALDADILATTSRRTSAAIEAILKKEFSGHARCKLLVIANELNIPEAVGGILGLSDIIVVSAESISMVSEASSSGKYVIVCDASVGKKHRRFLNNMSLRKHICLVPAQGIAERIEFLFRHKPQIDILNDRETVSRAYQRILL